jgi:hypothetical protein
MTTTHPAFTVTGESLTEIARDLFLEGQWRKALNLLVDGLEGISHAQAIDVLMHRAKLTGQNVLDIEEDKPTSDYLERVRFMYPPLLEIGQQYYVPSAYVTSYCVHDLEGPGRTGNRHLAMPSRNHWTGTQEASADKVWRSLYYARNPRTAYPVSLTLPTGFHREAPSRERVVLFEEHPAIPFWMLASNTPATVLQAFLEGGGELERVGGEFLPWEDEPVGFLPRTDPGTGDYIASLAESSGVAEEDVRSMLSPADDSDVPPVPEATADCHCGYIMTDGGVYACGYHQHKALAARLLKFTLGITDVSDPEQVLECHGAIRLSRSAIDHSYRAMFVKTPTASQKSKLRRWLEKYPHAEIEDLCPK